MNNKKKNVSADFGDMLLFLSIHLKDYQKS